MHAFINSLAMAAVVFWAASNVLAQTADDAENVKAANRAYYQALSARDPAAMESLWSHTAEATNVAPPIRLAAHVGWDAVRKNYQDFWNTLDELTVQCRSRPSMSKGMLLGFMASRMRAAV